MHSFQNFIVRLIPNHPPPLETRIWKLVVRALPYPSALPYSILYSSFMLRLSSAVHKECWRNLVVNNSRDTSVVEINSDKSEDAQYCSSFAHFLFKIKL